MKSIPRLLSPLTAAALLLAVPSNVSAHVRLLEPPPRVDGEAGGNQLKQGPCGQTPNGRTDTVSVFAPGETITVSWAEYIDHPSYYRIAFDVDGDDDFPVRPNESVSQDGDDPLSINPISDISQTLDSYILDYYLDDVASPPGGEEVYTTMVTLPNVECENCTLQVIQFMYDRQQPYYFQCADLALRAEAATADSTGSTDTGSTGTGSTDAGSTSTMSTSSNSSTTGLAASSTSGTTGDAASTTGFQTSAGSTTAGTTGGSATTGATTTGSPMTGSSTTGVPSTTTGAGVGSTGAVTATTAAPQPVAPAEDEAGCSCRIERVSHAPSWPLVLLGLGLVGYCRRRYDR